MDSPYFREVMISRKHWLIKAKFVNTSIKSRDQDNLLWLELILGLKLCWWTHRAYSTKSASQETHQWPKVHQGDKAKSINVNSPISIIPLTNSGLIMVVGLLSSQHGETSWHTSDTILLPYSMRFQLQEKSSRNLQGILYSTKAHRLNLQEVFVQGHPRQDWGLPRQRSVDQFLSDKIRLYIRVVHGVLCIVHQARNGSTSRSQSQKLGILDTNGQNTVSRALHRSTEQSGLVGMENPLWISRAMDQSIILIHNMAHQKEISG